VAGLCPDPPDKALERTRTPLPMKQGQPATMTHNDKRNGAATLFAALDVASGKVTGACVQRHRASEFIAFPAKIDAQTPGNLALHLIAGTYATRKTAEVTAGPSRFPKWLAVHPRFHMTSPPPRRHAPTWSNASPPRSAPTA
jgi:hypothetical protein